MYVGENISTREQNAQPQSYNFDRSKMISGLAVRSNVITIICHRL